MTLGLWLVVIGFLAALALVIWYDERKFRRRKKARGGMLPLGVAMNKAQHGDHVHIAMHGNFEVKNRPLGLGTSFHEASRAMNDLGSAMAYGSPSVPTWERRCNESLERSRARRNTKKGRRA